MINFDKLSRDDREYFYSLPFSVQRKIVSSKLNITCREDMQRYFTNIVK